MDDESPDGLVRLESAGIGSIVGGLVIGAASFVVAYGFAAGLTVGVGILTWALSRGKIARVAVLGLGCAAVGAIGLFEASGFGLGIEPLFLTMIAVVAGLIDIFLAIALKWIRSDDSPK